MEQRFLRYRDGRYEADVDITVEDWKVLLQNPKIFNEKSLDMIFKWYNEIDHQATSKTIMLKYPSESKGTPYNGIVDALTTRILENLDRFEIIGPHSEKSKFIVPFEAWHEDYNPSNKVVWKLRDQLAQALEELGMVDGQLSPSENDELTSAMLENTPEGKKVAYYTTRHERKAKNRRNAIRIHGKNCQGYGFDFEKIYGEIGKGFIEVHHTKPLYKEDSEIEINPNTDLICVCSNCHRIIHRRKDSIVTLKELQELVSRR